MHREVDRAGKERRFEFLGKQSLPPDLRKRHVYNAVALRLENFDLYFEIRVGLFQHGRDGA